MNRHLLLFIAVFFLLVSWFTNFRHCLRTWIARFRSQPSIAKRKRKNKSHPFPFPTKRPECPLCQAEEGMLPSEAPPEPPPLITHKRGRPRSIDTDLRYCPNNDCRYYGWLARGNTCPFLRSLALGVPPLIWVETISHSCAVLPFMSIRLIFPLPTKIV